MELLRRTRFAWTVLCLLAGIVLAALQLTGPAPAFAIAALWCAGWLSLPLYTAWAPIAKALAIWFLGVVPTATLIAPGQPVAVASSLALTGVAAAIVLWIGSGLFIKR